MGNIVHYSLGSQNQESSQGVWDCRAVAKSGKAAEKMKKIYFPSIYEINKEKNISFIPKIEKFLSKFSKNDLVRDIIIHGSYGDFTQTEYSDIELTLVTGKSLRKESQEFVKIKKEINKIIIDIDPLQHHGAFFLTEKELAYYSEADNLPLCAYEKSWSFRGLELDFCIVKSLASSKENSRHNLLITLNNFSDIKKNFFRYGRGAYAIKRLLSNFLMIPIFYYQCKGFEYNKPVAVANAIQEFPAEFKSLIRSATRIRSEWPRTPDWVKFLRKKTVKSSIPQGYFDLIIVNTYRNKMLEEMFKGEFLYIIEKFPELWEDFFSELFQ